MSRSTRDIIQEIADVRGRRLFGSSMAELPLRLFALEHAFAQYDRSNAELSKYFPVALIACVEGYFRMVVTDLIDSGEPFLSNAEKPASGIKLDFSVLRAVHGKSVTVGELVAHNLQLSRLEQVESTMSSLLGGDFKSGLSIIKDRWAHEVKGLPTEPILSDPNQVYADVRRTFELRHIICHEIASAYEIDVEEIGRCFQSCVSFLKAADEFVSETLHPGAPLTQTDMNIAAADSYHETEARLRQVSDDLRARLTPEEAEAFDESQARWSEYSEAWISFVAGPREDGGSIWPLVVASAAEDLAKQRTAQVEAWRRPSD
ncbi:lysozyme inhibitor LprI family protein [Achromobacter insolitus]|uniref:lysozyme inhibitor LprI family protein n=1 Tax=Achromobacter insolitus TaxID=217204 RepID=UPI00244EB59C|nr:lysozyme inhibitor LprI family protein [Achromobacter insolitus]MDH3062310.1 lysozyme inhibitor LprI family protein [Achromobacter insolitus]